MPCPRAEPTHWLISDRGEGPGQGVCLDRGGEPRVARLGCLQLGCLWGEKGGGPAPELEPKKRAIVGYWNEGFRDRMMWDGASVVHLLRRARKGKLVNYRDWR